MRSPRVADAWGLTGKCGLPARPSCALSLHPSGKPFLCLGLSLPGLGLLLGNGQGPGAKRRVAKYHTVFHTDALYSHELAKIELGFGRNPSMALNWFFVSQVAG